MTLTELSLDLAYMTAWALGDVIRLTLATVLFLSFVDAVTKISATLRRNTE